MKFYRYEFDYHPDFLRIELRTFDLMKETPKGYWIGHKGYIHWQKWVSKDSKARYAYPTKEEALNNYIKRTERRIKILKVQLELCEIGLQKANYLTP